MRKLLSGAGLALAAKVVTGFAVVAVAATVAASATAATGSANPDNWGQQVKAQVAKCKAELAANQHGIGACVSAFAKQHGELNAEKDKSAGAGKSHGNGNAFGHSKDKTKGQLGRKAENTPEVHAGD